jgi:hypothetical protein
MNHRCVRRHTLRHLPNVTMLHCGSVSRRKSTTRGKKSRSSRHDYRVTRSWMHPNEYNIGQVFPLLHQENSHFIVRMRSRQHDATWRRRSCPFSPSDGSPRVPSILDRQCGLSTTAACGPELLAAAIKLRAGASSTRPGAFFRRNKVF